MARMLAAETYNEQDELSIPVYEDSSDAFIKMYSDGRHKDCHAIKDTGMCHQSGNLCRKTCRSTAAAEPVSEHAGTQSDMSVHDWNWTFEHCAAQTTRSDFPEPTFAYGVCMEEGWNQTRRRPLPGTPSCLLLTLPSPFVALVATVVVGLPDSGRHGDGPL